MDRPQRGAALAGLAALTVAYVLSQFFRTMLGVIAPEIAADLGLAPTALGTAKYMPAASRISPNLTLTGGFGTGVQDMNATGGRIGLQAAW